MVVSLAILMMTLAVSAIWEKMVYTIPVLAVLLCLAAGMRALDSEPTSRQVDDTTADLPSEFKSLDVSSYLTTLILTP